MPDEIIKQGTMEVADFLGQVNDLVGKQEDSIGGLQLPMLKIAQPTTPQAMKGEGKIEGLEPGMFFNSVTQSVYGEKANFILLGAKNCFVGWGENLGDYLGEMSPQEAREKVKSGEFVSETFSMLVPKDVSRNKKNEPSEKWIDTNILYVLSADKPQDGIMIFSCASYMHKHGGLWYTKARAANVVLDGNKLPNFVFSHVWELSTMLNQKNGGSFYLTGDMKAKVHLCTPVGNIVNDPRFTHLQKAALDAKAFAEELKKKAVNYSEGYDAVEVPGEDWEEED